MVTARALSDLRNARLDAGLTQAEVADVIGIAASNLWRLEAGHVTEVTVERLSEIASVLGYEVSLGLHPVGDPVRDKGQLAVGRRFEALVSDKWRVTDETLLRRLASAWESKYHGDWHFDVANGAFQGEGGEAVVFEVVPTKVLAFAKGEFAQTRFRFPSPRPGE
jgi:transcriptional regulator with XRE-family HTH domain